MTRTFSLAVLEQGWLSEMIHPNLSLYGRETDCQRGLRLSLMVGLKSHVKCSFHGGRSQFKIPGYLYSRLRCSTLPELLCPSHPLQPDSAF